MKAARRMAVVLVLAVIASSSCAGAEPEEPRRREAARPGAAGSLSATSTASEPATTQTSRLGRFSRTRALADVRRLARTTGVRVRGTAPERRASRYVARRFRALGYNVRVQRFVVDGKRSRNVVAWWPGALDHPVVVGGHIDSVPRSPGANDNASGVAVILEVARLAAATRQARFVRFVAFGAEEYGTDGRHHVGSQVFVNRLGPRGRRRLAGMVSVDMVADGRPLLVGNSGIAHDVVARDLYRKLDRSRIAVAYRTLCDCSDNGPFERAGIPAAFMWSGDEPNYHSPTDTVANMSPADLARSGRALRAYVTSLRLELIRRYRRY